MRSMYKIGVIGSYDHICGFLALGFDTESVESVDEAKNALKRMAREDYGVIFITEDFVSKMREDCARYDASLTPAVIPIPAGKPGNSVKRLSAYVEQAVGSDIL